MAGSLTSDDATAARTPAAASVFTGSGEMRARCRAFDWASTPLGPVEEWPQSLATAAALVLANGFPAILLWGRELIQLYNDGYAPFLGVRHPRGLGQRTHLCWPEGRERREPIFARVFAGETVTLEEQRVLLLRHGSEAPGEDVFVTLSYVPVRDESGGVGGVCATVFDATSQVRARESEARLRAIYDGTYEYIGILTPDGTLLDCNRASLAFAGNTREEVIGKPFWETPWFAFTPGAPELLRQSVARAAAGEFVRYPAALARPTGDVITFDFSLHPIRDARGSVVYIVPEGRDVSDRQRVEAERERLLGDLRAERERLGALILRMPAPVALLTGPEHRHELVNDEFRRISGGGRDVTGLPVRVAFPELAGQGIYEQLDHVYATGEAYSAPESHVRYDRDGTGVQDTWFDVRFEPVRDAGGRVIGILNFAIDVTAQVLARQDMERLLRDSEHARADAERARERTDAVLGSIADAFYLLDRDWRFTYVNDAAEPLLQTTRDRLLGRTLWEAFPGVIGSEFEQPYREAMATGRTTSVEAYFAPLGTWFDVHTYTWTGGLMVHFRDIGARKAAEGERERLVHALEVERARLAEVFRRAPSFIVAFRGSDMVYDFVNEAYYQLVGHREIIGKPLLEAIPEIRGQGFDEVLDRVRVTGEPWVGRETPVLLQRTPGAPLEARYLDMVFQALTEADGTRSGVVVHGSDITAQVLARRDVERLLGESERARSEAESARRDAEAANRAKSEFLAVMSHELRTPLNAIGGYAELMELGIRGPITPEQRADLARIQQSQRHLLGLINGVLNYARVEAGAVHYAVEDVILDEVLATCEALIAPQLRTRRLTLSYEAPDRTLRVRADREKLQQIVLNLLSNAVKFTDAGGRLTLRGIAGDEAVDDQVHVEVSDTGIGIAPDQLARVFEPFVQVDAKLTRTQEGTGLGLAISRDLARGMGGDLIARSTPGAGSTFTLTLPRAVDGTPR